jgi:hypothetical protein
LNIAKCSIGDDGCAYLIRNQWHKIAALILGPIDKIHDKYNRISANGVRLLGKANWPRNSLLYVGNKSFMIVLDDGKSSWKDN